MVFRSKYFYKSLRKAFIIAATVLTLYGIIASYGNHVSDDFDDHLSPSYERLMDLTLVDVSIIKCWRSSCKIPEGYIKILPLLDHANPGHLFRYYVIAKHLRVETATRALVELSFEPTKDDQDLTNIPSDTEVVVVDNYTLKKRFVLTTPAEGPLSPDIPAIRDVEVLFGTSDLADSRPYYVGSHYVADESVHPVISSFRISANEAVEFKKELEQFQVLKNEMIFPFDNSKFKVLQLSDLHFGQASGKILPDGSLSSDLRTIRFVEHSLDEETPDLVVITGDLVDFDRSIDYKSVLLKALQPILSRKIRFIFTFGDELLGLPTKRSSDSADTSARIIHFLSSLPNCYNTVEGLESLTHGAANYNIKIIKDNALAAHITVLDSDQQKLDQSQTNYLYRINSGTNQNLYKLLFFHYPIPQFRPLGKFKIVGTYNEKHPLNSKTDTKILDDIINCGYQAVGVGHEHENDACILSEQADDRKIWLCYNSATGDSAHTRLDSTYIRKLRLFEIDFEKNVILSWKRQEKDKLGFDYQLIHPFS